MDLCTSGPYRHSDSVMASREPGDPRGDLYQEELKLLVPVKPPAQLRDGTDRGSDTLAPTVLQLRLTCQGLATPPNRTSRMRPVTVSKRRLVWGGTWPRAPKFVDNAFPSLKPSFSKPPSSPGLPSFTPLLSRLLLLYSAGVPS